MVQPLGDAPKHFLHPCTLFVHRNEHWVYTLLGSCVSVCLWDPQTCMGGINHYMLPLWNGEGLATPRYGNIAIEKLIEKMAKQGCPKTRLVAKVFGGAAVIHGEMAAFTVGDRNVALAQEVLAQRGINIVASEVGGTRGMKIIFNTRTGKVLVKRLVPGDPLAVDLPDGLPKTVPRA